MRKSVYCFLVLLAFSATSAIAGSGHDHGPATPINDTQALDRAQLVVKKLVEKEKLESSWSEAKCMDAEKKEGKTGPEWVVTCKNAKATDEKKQTMYVFFSQTGAYLAANFTGME